jgi:hypothetical protein
MNKLAQIKLSPDEGFTGFGPLGKPEGSGINIFATFISSAIGLMTIIAIIWFIFLLITGAYGIMSAGSDKAQLEAARKRITNGIIGIVVIIAAIFILDLIGFLFDIPFLNIGELFEKILIK